MSTVDVITLARLDEIRLELGLGSRGQALDAAITQCWSKWDKGLTIPSGGDREQEILARIDGMARAMACTSEQAIACAVAAFEPSETRRCNGRSRFSLMDARNQAGV
jgi:hypothetical protein